MDEQQLNLIAVRKLLDASLELAEKCGIYVRVDQVMDGAPAMGGTKPVVIVEQKHKQS